jgi:hypothetical protein
MSHVLVPHPPAALLRPRERVRAILRAFEGAQSEAHRASTGRRVFTESTAHRTGPCMPTSKPVGRRFRVSSSAEARRGSKGARRRAQHQPPSVLLAQPTSIRTSTSSTDSQTPHPPPHPLSAPRTAQVKPAVKLPYMYVMDSIMKNSREPYVELFSHNLPAVFRDTYRACGVVAGLQPKLERLFATWHSQRVLRPPLLRVIEAQIPELRAPHLNPRFAPVSAPLAYGCAQDSERGETMPRGRQAAHSGVPAARVGEAGRASAVVLPTCTTKRVHTPRVASPRRPIHAP